MTDKEGQLDKPSGNADQNFNPELVKDTVSNWGLNVARILSQIPNDILLLLKVNDFMRSLNTRLGKEMYSFCVDLDRLNEFVIQEEKRRGTKVD